MKSYRKRFNKIVEESMKLTPNHWIAISAILLTFLAFILYQTQFSDFARCVKGHELAGRTVEAGKRICGTR